MPNNYSYSDIRENYNSNYIINHNSDRYNSDRYNLDRYNPDRYNRDERNYEDENRLYDRIRNYHEYLRLNRREEDSDREENWTDVWYDIIQSAHDREWRTANSWEALDEPDPLPAPTPPPAPAPPPEPPATPFEREYQRTDPEKSPLSSKELSLMVKTNALPKDVLQTIFQMIYDQVDTTQDLIVLLLERAKMSDEIKQEVYNLVFHHTMSDPPPQETKKDKKKSAKKTKKKGCKDYTAKEITRMINDAFRTI